MFGKPSKEKLLALGAKGKFEKIRPYAEHKDPAVRLAAAEALGLIDSDESANLLILLLRSPDAALQMAAAKALGNTSYQPAAEQLRLLHQRTGDEALKAVCTEGIHSIKNRA